jgi:hypothetical protein
MSGAPTTANVAANVAPDGPALNKIEWVVRNLGVTIGDHAAPQVGSTAGSSLVALQKSRIAWDNTRKAIQIQLKALEAAVVQAVHAHNADPASEDEYDEGELTRNIPKLYTLLDKLDTRLIDKLDAALNAEPDQRLALQHEAGGIIKDYQKVLAGDPTLTLIDNSKLLPSPIRPIVEKTLSVLATQI